MATSARRKPVELQSFEDLVSLLNTLREGEERKVKIAGVPPVRIVFDADADENSTSVRS